MDPSGFPDGMNNYQYTQSDPVNCFDPDGLKTLVLTEPAGQNVGVWEHFCDNPENWFGNGYDFTLQASVATQAQPDGSVLLTLSQRVWEDDLIDDDELVDFTDQPRTWEASCDDDCNLSFSYRGGGLAKLSRLHNNHGKIATGVSVVTNDKFIVFTHSASWIVAGSSGSSSGSLSVEDIEIGETEVGGATVELSSEFNIESQACPWSGTTTFRWKCEQ